MQGSTFTLDAPAASSVQRMMAHSSALNPARTTACSTSASMLAQAVWCSAAAEPVETGQTFEFCPQVESGHNKVQRGCDVPQDPKVLYQDLGRAKMTGSRHRQGLPGQYPGLLGRYR